MTRKAKQPNFTPNNDPGLTAAGQRLAEASHLALAAEIELQRQVNQRLLGLWNALEGAGEPDAALQVKVAAALTSGTGRVARLLRDERALTGQAGDGLAAAVAHALNELTTELGAPA